MRLPDKPLADIAGVPMIVHVMRRAEEADLGRVAVACAEREIAEAVTAAGGRHVCLRRIEPAAVFDAVARHKVTTLCGAPVVLTMLIHAPEADKRRFDHECRVFTGGAAPPSVVIAGMEKMGFAVTQRSEEHTSELQSRTNPVCRLLLEKKNY